MAKADKQSELERQLRVALSPDKPLPSWHGLLRTQAKRSTNLEPPKEFELPASPACDIVIITALPVEFQAVSTYLQEIQEVTHPEGTVYLRGTFQREQSPWHVVVVEVDINKSSVPMATERALSFFQPNLVFFVGVAGGIKDVKVGDVVVANKIYGYELSKTMLQFEQHPMHQRADDALKYYVKVEARKTHWLKQLGGTPPMPTPHVFIAPLVASEQFVASQQSMYGDAVAVEMKGYGSFQTMHTKFQAHGLVIRGISELVEQKVETDTSVFQEMAARHAAAFAFAVLAHFSPIQQKQALPATWMIPVERHLFYTGREDLLEVSNKQVSSEQSVTLSQPQTLKGLGRDSSMVEAPAPVEIFCSYAHEDETWRDKLERHVSPLKQQGLISLWHDRLIIPGMDWAKTIDTHLETASIILLLVSANFFSSDYCYGIEMKRALARQETNEALVIPILVRPVYWQHAPFAHVQVLPPDIRPLSTWPDEELALTEVVSGIYRAIENAALLSANARSMTLPSIWNIPYPRNPFFLGREAELARIRQHLLAGQATALSQPQAISGLGGIGKTQLALEYAYRYHQGYQAVLWARAESTEALISSYVALAVLLKLPEHNAKEQEVSVQAVKTWLRGHIGWLLILDNADELTLLPDFLPSTFEGHLLLTTRAAATGRLAHCLEIKTMGPEQGALFLLRRSRLIANDAPLKLAPSQEQKLAVQISQELGGLPLALDQAGAYLEETGCGLSDYQQIYQRRRAMLLSERRGVVVDHPEPVTSTWSLSFDRIIQKNSAAADLLCLCAFLAPDAIPEELLMVDVSSLRPMLAPIAVDAFQHNQAIETLRASSLIWRDPQERMLSIHRLVQAVFQDTLEDRERRTWAERAILAVNAAFPHVEHSTWSQCERLLPQALVATQAIHQYQIIDEEAGHLLYETASYLQTRARYVEAEPIYQQALHIQKQLLGSGHPDVATTLIGLASLYRRRGKYGEAKPFYQQALRIREQQLGPEHPLVSYPLIGLANIHREQSKYEEAELLYQRALHILKQQLGLEHPDLAYPLNDLANLYLKQGKYGEAGPLYQQALHIWEQQVGPEHPETAVIMDDFARLREAEGSQEEARSLYVRALAIREQVLGARHPKTIETRARLVALLRAMGWHEQATQLETT